eukprot:scaffold412_cov388-Prasinococcus_capsulatus_cf.AAC.54
MLKARGTCNIYQQSQLRRHLHARAGRHPRRCHHGTCTCKGQQVGKAALAGLPLVALPGTAVTRRQAGACPRSAGAQPICLIASTQACF